MRLLLVEDDVNVARLVARSLRESGHQVGVAYDGPTGLVKAQSEKWDAIILDVVLPGRTGLGVCRALRRQQVLTPILMLTARDAVPDRVAGLDAGADDYLTKPFAVDELQARLRAVMRRAIGSAGSSELLRIADLVLDLGSHDAHRGDRLMELTNREFGLLSYLMRNAGRVLTRDQIKDHAWGHDADLTSNLVDIYIHYLREKVDRGFPRPLIRTVRGVGYMIKA